MRARRTGPEDDDRAGRFMLGTELIVGLGLAPGIAGLFVLGGSPSSLVAVIAWSGVLVSLVSICVGVWYVLR